MDSNVKKDVELAKKSCDKAREIIKSKRHAALALLASIGICLTLVVVTFALGSLFGYYLANLQMLRIEHKVETVKEDKIETNQTIGGIQRFGEQLEHKVTENQTTISTTTQISTSTTADDLPYFKISFAPEENEETKKENIDQKKKEMDEIIPIWNEIFDTLELLEPRGLLEPSEPDTQPISPTTSKATDEDLAGFKIRISFDNDENDETEKLNVDPKEEKIDEKIPNWNDIFDTLETLEHWEQSDPVGDAQPISTTTTNPEDLSQTEFVEDEFIGLNPVFKTTAKSDEPEDFDDESYDDDDEDDDAVQEPVSLKPNEFKTQNPITPRQPFRIDNLLSIALLAKYKHFEHKIHRCSFKLSQKCSAPAERKIINEQKDEIWSILRGEFPVNESEAQYITRIQNWTHQIDAAIERIVSTRVDLCAGDDDYECRSCVKRNANCYFTNGDTCNTPVEWNIIGYIPRMTIADKDLCYHNPLI